MLPESIVAKIFIRMTLRYGKAWISTLRGEDGEDSKAEWARELSGTSISAVEHALEALPDGDPPNIEQFKSLCVFGPAAAKPRRSTDADPAHVAAELARMNKVRAQLLKAAASTSDLKWAYELRAREARGESISEVSKQAWRSALGEAAAEPVQPVWQDEPRRNR